MLVVCCGMIRAGSTLQFNLARSLVEITGSGCGQGFIEDPPRDRRLRRWCWDRTLHVVKMHTIADWMLDTETQGVIRFLYCHRNLYDVTASAKRKFHMPSYEIWKHLDHALLLHRELMIRPNAIIQRYDQLIEDPSKCLSGLASALNLVLNSSIRSEILDACSLDQAKAMQETLKLDTDSGSDESTKLFDLITLIHRNHISETNGEDGTWHGDLTPHDLHMIDRHYGPWLNSEGYYNYPLSHKV